MVSGLNSRLSHALTPVLLDVGIVLGPVKGLPPPKTHSLPAITAEPGTLTPLGIVAPRCPTVSRYVVIIQCVQIGVVDVAPTSYCTCAR